MKLLILSVLLILSSCASEYKLEKENSEMKEMIKKRKEAREAKKKESKSVSPSVIDVELPSPY